MLGTAISQATGLGVTGALRRKKKKLCLVLIQKLENE